MWIGIDYRRFQFPTGWNSTFAPISIKMRQSVSIPNGMEFYNNTPKKWGGVQFPTGWNSTIRADLDEPRSKIVSIPNGMEFYCGVCSQGAWIYLVSIPNGMEFYVSCLPSALISRKFQFPTGWNSTLIAVADCGFDLVFQFPTGWNSTGYLNPPKSISSSFNSQRDGILRIHQN